MADDYRIKVEFEDEGSILHFGRSLREREFEKELREQLGDGVIVTHDGSEVFLYASTLEQAQAAERAVREVLEHLDHRQWRRTGALLALGRPALVGLVDP